MATSVDATLSPANLSKEESTSLLVCSPSLSPSSDKWFWSVFRNRVDSILEKKHREDPTSRDRVNPDPSLTTHVEKRGQSVLVKRMKEDSLMLLRGFDSVAHTLSQLSNNLDSALAGTRGLAEPPTLSEILFSNLKNSETDQDEIEKQPSEDDEEENETTKKGLKRKVESSDVDTGTDDSLKKNEDILNDHNLKKAKNLAVSMAKRAASLARELKLIKSDLAFLQERSSLLEEENHRLRGGFNKGIRPEEDDLMRLQMEALLAEKSRFANENADLIRENRCLHQLVEYHQFTTQDLSASYEQLLHGMFLDFSSPPGREDEGRDKLDDLRVEESPRENVFGLCASLDKRFDEETEP